MSFLQQKLGARIQQIRKSKKMTQERLAEIIGLDIPNISNIERGKRFISAATLEKIIKALDVSPKELFDFEHIKTKSDLIDSINKIIITATNKELIFYYRIMKLYRENQNEHCICE